MKVNRAFASRRFSRHKSSESGYVLILVALSMVVFLRFVALAVDVGYLEHIKLRMQSAADAAALAGAQELVRNGTGADLNTVIRGDVISNGFADATNKVTLVVHHPRSAACTTEIQYNITKLVPWVPAMTVQSTSTMTIAQ